MLAFARDANELLHLVEVSFEGVAACAGELVLSAGHPRFEEFAAADVVGFFEFAGVHAEVAVGSFEQTLEIVEAERIVGGERAENSETQAFVDQAIEFGERCGARRTAGGLVLMIAGGCVLTGFSFSHRIFSR